MAPRDRRYARANTAATSARPDSRGVVLFMAGLVDGVPRRDERRMRRRVANATDGRTVDREPEPGTAAGETANRLQPLCGTFCRFGRQCRSRTARKTIVPDNTMAIDTPRGAYNRNDIFGVALKLAGEVEVFSHCRATT